MYFNTWNIHNYILYIRLHLATMTAEGNQKNPSLYSGSFVSRKMRVHLICCSKVPGRDIFISEVPEMKVSTNQTIFCTMANRSIWSNKNKIKNNKT